MTLYEQFIEYANSKGIETEDIYHERGEDFELVSFGENAPSDGDLIYNISLAFYDKDDLVEIFIRKTIKDNDPMGIYKAINDINFKARGVTFVYFTGMLCMKSHCFTNDINGVLRVLAKNMQIAQSVFREFEPA